MKYVTANVSWDKTYRLINSSYPPIDLFEDIAEPDDWDLLCEAESKTNPRLSESIGNLSLVPKDRRVSGTGSSYVMAPFTHISKDNSGRFHDGTFGAYYAGDSFETALYEKRYHLQQFFLNTNEEKGWITDLRELVGSINHRLVDIRRVNHKKYLNKKSYTESQKFASFIKNKGEDGIIWPSVRLEPKECFAVFYPDVISIPKQGKHIGVYWNGKKIDKYRIYKAPKNIVNYL